ncbi:MAG: hypothetical protein IKS00_04835 [Bacteroidales bacterium]|nr:hypothetical protein [Bacteroidales bacterium]
MKKNIILFAALLIFSATAFAQDELSTKARNYRDEVKRFLQEEGFSPTVDGSEIDFKKEGVSYWIRFYYSDPVLVSFQISGFNNNYSDKNAMLEALSYSNLKLCSAKAFLFDDNAVGFAVQYYSASPEEFKYSFYKNMSDLSTAKKRVEDKYIELEDRNANSSGSNEPFRISSALIGNTDYDGNVLTDYGKNIYSSSTQYLKPKLYIDTYTEGSYDIYVKFYAPGGLSTGSSSPSGYSYKSTLSLTKNSREYKLSGWGSSDSGNWKSGEYRLELYYKDKLLYTKYFTIY